MSTTPTPREVAKGLAAGRLYGANASRVPRAHVTEGRPRWREVRGMVGTGRSTLLLELAVGHHAFPSVDVVTPDPAELHRLALVSGSDVLRNVRELYAAGWDHVRFLTPAQYSEQVAHPAAGRVTGPVDVRPLFVDDAASVADLLWRAHLCPSTPAARRPPTGAADLARMAPEWPVDAYVVIEGYPRVPGGFREGTPR